MILMSSPLGLAPEPVATPDATTIDYDALNAMRGAGGVEPIWLPNPWLAAGGRVLMLGCGAKPMVGAVNHDRVKHSPWVDAAWNLETMPWGKPIEDYTYLGVNLVLKYPQPLDPTGDGFDACYAYDLVEHIEDVFGFLNEIHMLLRPGGILVMRGGAFDNPATFIDPTHRHWFTEESMDFVDPDRPLGKSYGQFYTDGLGRPLAKWHIDGVDRVNADPRWPATPDIQWTLVKVAE